MYFFYYYTLYLLLGMQIITSHTVDGNKSFKWKVKRTYKVLLLKISAWFYFSCDYIMVPLFVY